MQLHVGIVGLGVAGMHHLEAFGKIAGVQVTACDVAEERRRAAARKDIRVVPELEEVLASGPDAVVVAVPHSALAGVALRSLKAGCHVLLEKPMATRLEDAVAVVECARAVGRHIMMSFVHRFRPDVAIAKDLIRRGEIGRPTVLVDTMASGASAMPNWVWSRAQAGGGMMFYNGIHQVDRARFLLDDDVVRVRAEVDTLGYEVDTEDTVGALLRFRKGAMGVIVQHKARADAIRGWDTQVFGTKGSVLIKTGHVVKWVVAGTLSTQPGVPEDRFFGAATEFVAALRQGRPPSPSGEDGLAALKVVLSMYEDRELVARAQAFPGTGS